MLNFDLVPDLCLITVTCRWFIWVRCSVTWHSYKRTTDWRQSSWINWHNCLRFAEVVIALSALFVLTSLRDPLLQEYLLDCLINGRQPDLNWIGGRPYVPPDIYYFKWIEHPRTLSFASDRVLASMESLDLNTSRWAISGIFLSTGTFDEFQLFIFLKYVSKTYVGFYEHLL